MHDPSRSITRVEPRLAKQIEHLGVRGKQQRAEGLDSLLPSALREQLEQDRPQPAPLPVIDHRHRHLGVVPRPGAHETRDAHSLPGIWIHSHQCLVIVVVHLGQVAEHRLPQLRRRREEAPVARLVAQTIEAGSDQVLVPWLDGTHEHHRLVAKHDLRWLGCFLAHGSRNRGVDHYIHAPAVSGETVLTRSWNSRSRSIQAPRRRQLVRLLSGEIGVEHRILGFPDRRIGELDRKGRVGLGVVCAPAGPVDVDLRLLGLNLLLELGDVLVPVPLDVVPSGGDLVAACVGSLA